MFSARSVALAFAVATVWTAAAQTPATQQPSAAAHPAFATGSSTPLGAQIAALLAEPRVARAHWGVAVTELDGTPIYGLEEGKLFRPASNAKLFTTAAAMALLGPEARVTTTVQTGGIVDAAGTLGGDLILAGAGDANLSGRRIPYESPAQRRDRLALRPEAAPDPLGPIDDLAAQVAARGIKRITGQVLGYDGIWPHEPYAIGWGIDDMVWGYGAPVSALAVNDNQMELTLTGGKVGSAPLMSISPDVLFLPPNQQVEAVTVAASRGSNIDIDREDLQNDVLHITGRVAAGATDDEQVAVLDPAKFAALALAEKLKLHGVEVNAAEVNAAAAVQTKFPTTTESSSTARDAVPDLTPGRAAKQPDIALCAPRCTVLASRVSVPLAQDVVVTLKVSQNLHAEMLLRRLGAAYGAAGTFAQGTRVVRQYLLNAGLDGGDFIFYDGSGLSTHDLVTPRATVQLLAYASRQPWFAQWKAGLPVGGEDGSLASRFADAPLKGHVFAKTGTLGETRALSGYVDCRSGKQVVFSVMVDNHTPAGSDDRVAMDRIVALIAASN